MRESGGPTAQQIKEEIPQMPETIFHIVAEDIKGPHVSEEMPESPMEKHKSEKGNDLLSKGEVRRDFRDGIADRDQTVSQDKKALVRTLHHLNQEEKDVDTDNEGVDDRIVLGFDCVTDRYHG